MPEKIRLSKQNEENLNRIATVINASATAIGNYIINKGTKLFEENFKKLDKEIQEEFKKALKK